MTEKLILLLLFCCDSQKGSRCLWWEQERWHICGARSEACLPCSGCDWVGEWASAGNWRPSHCIRKPIGLHSGVLTQLKSSASSWRRGQPQFITAVVRRLASNCLRHWFCWRQAVFDWLNHPYAAGRSSRMRRILIYSNTHCALWYVQSVQCSNMVTVPHPGFRWLTRHLTRKGRLSGFFLILKLRFFCHTAL